MTMQRSRVRNFPQTPLNRQRSANTLRLRHLMEAQQRAEIGQRIRDLREASPETNRSIGDYVGVGERSVANWIAGQTGITYEHAKKVAELFDVDVRWLWDGKERHETPDLMTAFSNGDLRSQLDRIETRQIETLEGIARLARQLEEGTAQAPPQRRRARS